MFWLGLTVALVSGLTGIGLSRDQTKKRFPKVADLHLDLVAIALLVVGLIIAAIDYRAQDKELNQVRMHADEALAKHKPRSILAEHREKLISCLRDAPKGKVLVSFGMLDGEATTYGEQIGNVLTSAGFETKIPRLPDGNASLAVLTPGCHIVVRDLKAPPRHAIAIQRCFLAVGIRMEAIVSGDSNFESNCVEISIGQKP